jgi:GT2 family glycosyltransferase
VTYCITFPIRRSSDGEPSGEIFRLITISIVSHGHSELVAGILEDLRRHLPTAIEVILTLNIEEALPFDPNSFPFPVKVIRNTSPRGFASNHNSAFESARGTFFCVLNPDIRLGANPFPALFEELLDPSVGVASPLILGPDGTIEDSARPFPTLPSLVWKALGAAPKRYYEIGEKSISPDWIGGMFMLFRRDAFAAVGGFDTRYHLYYEDVDVCARLRLAGYDIRLVPKVFAVHAARRQSRRDVNYLFWHLSSMARYLLSGTRRKVAKRLER